MEMCRSQYVQIDIFFNTFSIFKKVKIFENILGKQKNDCESDWDFEAPEGIFYLVFEASRKPSVSLRA